MCQTPDPNSTIDCRSLSQCSKRRVGFDARNKDSLVTYICCLCNFLLRSPIQLICGHRFCHSCMNVEESSTVKCNICNEVTLRDKIILDKGCQHDMEKLNIMCSLCEWSDIFKNYQKHLDTVHLNLFCEYCGQEFKTVDDLNQHISICEKFTVNCLLQPYGCTEQFLRVNTQSHLLGEQHQSVLLQYLFKHKQHLINDQSDMSSHTTITTDRETEETSHANLKPLFETADILLGGIQSLNDDIQHVSSELLHHQNSIRYLSDDLSKMKIAIEETHSSVDAQTVNQQILEESINSLHQQLDDFKNLSTDGTLIWRIANVKHKMVDAESERQISIYSPVFYSSPNGYKMRLRLYLTGDGNARRTHMSLFFVLMRGEYDSVLQFPFSYKVTFCLLDQTSQQRHIIDSFRPDVKSSSFQRPRSDMNVASGIPKFVPLTIIQQDNNPYVRDDIMFIKAIVDFGELPKSLIPYTLSLNPGLPILIQQEWIRRELEKRAREKLVNKTEISTFSNQNVRAGVNSNHDEQMIQ
ncbi:unnamed protein product [Rotaria sordida]|uniref:Uncharacterized protein n=2 Tax=Rotaria sordida TaxID=392033 RepID=A0A814XFI3_9BILA|nr:unnamed protein product [Rotaria sordida]